jgi:hypothetical protein
MKINTFEIDNLFNLLQDEKNFISVNYVNDYIISKNDIKWEVIYNFESLRSYYNKLYKEDLNNLNIVKVILIDILDDKKRVNINNDKLFYILKNITEKQGDMSICIKYIDFLIDLYKNYNSFYNSIIYKTYGQKFINKNEKSIILNDTLICDDDDICDPVDQLLYEKYERNIYEHGTHVNTVIYYIKYIKDEEIEIV